MGRKRLIDSKAGTPRYGVICANCKHAICVDQRHQTYYCIPPDGSTSHVVNAEFGCDKGEKK